jgi:ketosteroid isomerase-like protein
MSQANVELMARAIDVLNARDAEAIDALFDEEVEWRPALTAGGAVEGAVYRGKSGMTRYLEDVDSGFDEMWFEVERFDRVGLDRVFYRGRVIARGSASGIPLDVPIWGLWEIRNGRLIRGYAFLTEKEALEAAGLSE